jgi:hypothetical protein
VVSPLLLNTLIPSDCPTEYSLLIQKCSHYDPFQRATLREIGHHFNDLVNSFLFAGASATSTFASTNTHGRGSNRMNIFTQLCCNHPWSLFYRYDNNHNGAPIWQHVPRHLLSSNAVTPHHCNHNAPGNRHHVLKGDNDGDNDEKVTIDGSKSDGKMDMIKWRGKYTRTSMSLSIPDHIYRHIVDTHYTRLKTERLAVATTTTTSIHDATSNDEMPADISNKNVVSNMVLGGSIMSGIDSATIAIDPDIVHDSVYVRLLGQPDTLPVIDDLLAHYPLPVSPSLSQSSGGQSLTLPPLNESQWSTGVRIHSVQRTGNEVLVDGYQVAVEEYLLPKQSGGQTLRTTIGQSVPRVNTIDIVPRPLEPKQHVCWLLLHFLPLVHRFALFSNTDRVCQCSSCG